MKIGIIHFSDIHFKEKIEDNSVLKKKNKIVEKLKNQILAFDKIFLVISGDLAFSGQEKEYLIFNDFIQEIIQKLTEYSKKNIMFLGIPGNHDCNFSESQKTRNLIIDGLERENFADLDNDIVDTCTIPQKEYLIYQENNFFKGGIFLIKHKLLNIVNYQFENFNIIFNCLNTSWTSKLHERAGKLAFPINFFDEESFENDATLKINIIHHPINWQNDYNHRELMIEDLSKNYLKQGMKFADTEKLLGKNQLSDGKDSLQLQYEIYTYYGSDIDPIETKTLIVNFSADSTLTNIWVDHWEK